jgi:hypothetical protein
MIPDFSGDFLNYDSTQDGDIITILDEGKIEFNETLKKNMFNIHVKKGEKTLTWSPNNSHGRAVQTAFGKDSKDWINKKVQILHINKKMEIRPIVETKA